jgi:two-component system sensor histidine kinase HydH
LREIQIQTDLAPELPLVRADSVKLTQAMVNLVINAIQAVGRSGCVRVSASVSPTALRITVQDSGPGIPPDQLASIFDPYFTTKTEGHGLGLWIAQQIATAHGGEITVRNLPEEGAAFTMTIPRATKLAPNA